MLNSSYTKTALSDQAHLQSTYIGVFDYKLLVVGLNILHAQILNIAFLSPAHGNNHTIMLSIYVTYVHLFMIPLIIPQSILVIH